MILRFHRHRVTFLHFLLHYHAPLPTRTIPPFVCVVVRYFPAVCCTRSTIIHYVASAITPVPFTVSRCLRYHPRVSAAFRCSSHPTHVLPRFPTTPFAYRPPHAALHTRILRPHRLHLPYLTTTHTIPRRFRSFGYRLISRCYVHVPALPDGCRFVRITFHRLFLRC